MKRTSVQRASGMGVGAKARLRGRRLGVTGATEISIDKILPNQEIEWYIFSMSEIAFSSMAYELERPGEFFDARRPLKTVNFFIPIGYNPLKSLDSKK